MYALTPTARKRQEMLMQQYNSNQRLTRQIDTKNPRQTFNSRNEKLLNIDKDVTIKKKQKLHHGNDDSKFTTKPNHANDTMIPDFIVSEGVNKENSTIPTVTKSNEDECNEENNVVTSTHYHSVSYRILGQGHIQLLHAYVRETLFKNIKILSPAHLETRGEIMQDILTLLKYSEKMNGNLTAFVSACRMEIRKTMSSRRGYVKRQTGLLLTGKAYTINIAVCLIVFNLQINFFRNVER